MLMIDYATKHGQPVPMPAGGVIPCPALIRQDSSGCIDVFALTLPGLMNGVIMPKAFLSPVQTRKNIHKIAFYKFPNVNNENPLDADINKASVSCEPNCVADAWWFCRYVLNGCSFKYERNEKRSFQNLGLGSRLYLNTDLAQNS